MILLALRGENFMKFRRIKIENVPRRGLIGIEGANEAGKSTVGELIQFGLFGKTISTGAGSVLDLIRWDEDHCIVELDFEIDSGPEAARYRVWREIDRHGTNFARLLRLDDGSELAAGIMKVQEQLEGLIHFSYDDFWRSFYLAEDAHPRSADELREFLDRIVGADVLRSVKDEAHAEVRDLEEDFGRLQGEVKRNKMQIDKYVPNIASIPELEAAREQHHQRIAELKREWEEGVRRVADAESKIRQRERVRDRIRNLVRSPARTVSEAVDELVVQVAEVVEGTESEDGGAGAGSGDDRARGGKDGGGRGRGARGGRGRGRQSGKMGERAQSLARICQAFATLSGRVEQEISGLRKRLLGEEDDALPVRERRTREDRDQAARRRSVTVGAGVFFLVVGLALGVVALTVYLDPEGAPFTEFIQRTQQFIAATGVLATMSVGLSFALLLRVRGLSRRVRELGVELGEIEESRRREKHRLDHLEQLATADHGLDDLVAALEPWVQPGLEEALEFYQSALRDDLAEGQDVRSLIGAIADDEHRRVQEQRARVKELKKDGQKCTEQEQRETSKRDRCESEMREYQKQEGRREQLEQQNSTLREQADAIREEIDSRYLLEQLVDETVDSIRHRAGPSLGKSMRRLLPSLTDGRYSDMQITADFRMRLFTSEKSDFLRTNELSGGTCEGLAFGFRLVFSQAFIKAVTRSSQFLFLDEPFKSMDRQRVHKTLQVLTRLSPEVAQVFVVLPDIDDADRELFDFVLTTSVEDEELVHDFTGRGSASARERPTRDEAAPGETRAASGQRSWTGFFPAPVEDDDGDISTASHP